MKALPKREVIEHALTIEGWMSQAELENLFDWAAEMQSIVEVGSWKGRSTYVLCKACPGTVTAVDTFKGSANDAEHLRLVAKAGGSTYAEFMRNMAGCANLTVLQKDSLRAAEYHPQVDGVFIDGGHSEGEPLADLKAWLPLAKKSICGHDWQFDSVKRAVREVLGEVELGADNLWFKRLDVVKPVPLFSILHTSARPDKWRAVYDDWMNKAVHPEQVEYVLCIDPRWGFSASDMSPYDTPLDNIRVVLNNRRKCYVDGVNIAAWASTGSILIVNADDQFACDGWDRELLSVYFDWNKSTLHSSGRVAAGAVKYHQTSPEERSMELASAPEFVIECDEGGDEHARGIMPMPILSRARYEQQGCVFYPEYESMGADNDFCEAARKDGVVIEALHLLFPHRHPMYDQWQGTETDPRWDEAYKAQNRREAYEVGMKLLLARRAAGLPPMQQGVTRRMIALCLSGEQFQGVWVDALLNLYGHLIDLGFIIMKIRGMSSNVYVTRESIRRAIVNSEVRPDLCLWIDDDNPLTPTQFDKLLAGLDAHPEIDGVSGWCWIHNEQKTGFMTSCGEWAPDHLHWSPFPPRFAHEQELRPFETGGFPVFLMRYSALDKAGDGAFLPIVDNRLEHGLTGEDLSFFLHAEQGGAKFLVDPTVRVPHLKYVEVEPVFESQGRAPVKVACMIRAKNEARWIGRTIESVKALCGEDIYVMEDGSIDNTVEVAQYAGAIVLPSPFVGEAFNEVRDKDWLLEHVKGACSPDWILMIDGDEELEPGGCQKIRHTLERNPAIDCFALRVLYLWNSVDTIRLDGVYENMARQSLFRANSNLSFRSYYQGEGENQNHCGLHCSNAPGLGGMRIATLNILLLHYGYLHREDRIRKYEWILGLDPDNEKEDFYQHSVQGDIPEVPADAKLKHGGPLRLSKLPPRLIPNFEVVPGPWAADAAEVDDVRRRESPELAAAD